MNLSTADFERRDALLVLKDSLSDLHSTMALLDTTCLCYTLSWFYLDLLVSTTLYHGSSWLYYILPCLYVMLYDSTTLYNGST